MTRRNAMGADRHSARPHNAQSCSLPPDLATLTGQPEPDSILCSYRLGALTGQPELRAPLASSSQAADSNPHLAASTAQVRIVTNSVLGLPSQESITSLPAIPQSYKIDREFAQLAHTSLVKAHFDRQPKDKRSMLTMIKLNRSSVSVEDFRVWEDNEFFLFEFSEYKEGLIQAKIEAAKSEGELRINYTESDQEWTLIDCGMMCLASVTNGGVTTNWTISGIATDRIPA